MAFATIHYFSQSLGKASSFNVVFPEDPKIAPPWSVFYLLHGLSDDNTIWTRRTSVERYVAGLPLVLVMPDGGRGWYTNAQSPPNFRYEDDLVVDVVGLVDRTFPVKKDRSGRAIGGLSMGGYGALKIGLKHLDKFSSVTSHSGALAITDREPGKILSDIPDYVSVFGPSPKGGPEDLRALVEKIDHGRIPALRIDCGENDFLIDENRAFHKHLDDLHIKHEYQEFPGEHNWEYWDLHVREAIEFHARNLGLKRV